MAVLGDHTVVQLVLDAEGLQGRGLVLRTRVLLQERLSQGRLSGEPVHGVEGQNALQDANGYREIREWKRKRTSLILTGHLR